MAEFSKVWAAACRDGIQGALEPVRVQRRQYVAYLQERERDGAGAGADEFAELVTLTDRGLMAAEDIVLEHLIVSGSYEQALRVATEVEGGVEIQAGPARLRAGGSQVNDRTSTTNLQASATYRSRPRSEFLAATMESLPARPPVGPTA